jgi:hypothetical protein
MSTPVDIMIPLGSGSKHADIELKYCLRSIEKYLFKYRDVYIVGQLPAWPIQNIIHIPAEDNNQKEVNIKNKILAACAEKKLTEHFLFMNDDHFFLHNTVASEYPYYHKGTLTDSLSRRIEKGWTEGYYLTLQNTCRALQKEQLPINNFDIHTPVLYHKLDFVTIAKRYNWDVEMSLAIKSIYCNSKKINGQRLYDCRINKALTLQEITAKFGNRNVFSVGDDGLSETMIQFLDNRFPTKSRYEQ